MNHESKFRRSFYFYDKCSAVLRFSSLYRRLSYAAPGRGRRRSRRPYILHLSPCRPLLRCTPILMVWLFVLGTGSEIWASGGAGAACATYTMITTLITQQAKSVSDIFHPFLFVSRKLHMYSVLKLCCRGKCLIEYEHFESRCKE